MSNEDFSVILKGSVDDVWPPLFPELPPLKRWQVDIYGYALAKGWWESNRPFSECIALMHSEVTESRNALSAALNQGTTNIFEHIWYRKKDQKPEGYMFELADIVIRILDTAEHFNIDLDNAVDQVQQLEEETFRSFHLHYNSHGPAGMLLEIHSRLSDALEAYRDGKANEDVMPHQDLPSTFYGIAYSLACALLIVGLETNARCGHEIFDYVEEKHNFNLTREYKHGGKRI